MSETPENEPGAPEATPMTEPEAVVAEQAAPVAFDDLGQEKASRIGAAPLDTLLDIAVDVSIRFGAARMTVQEVLALGPGSVVQLDRMVGEPIDVFVSDQKFGEGEIVVVGDHFGIRLTKVASAQSPLAAV